MSVMEFDPSKENIQPLRGGRNVTQLGVALQAQSNQEYQQELLQQREDFENAIRNYEGDDPLDNWYHYISWIEQSYPKHGHEGNLVPLLEDCLAKFENDKLYMNDGRFCKLWIKYIDLQQNPLELYHMMHARGLCKGCADLYRAWAYYHEAVGDYRSADMVFQLGRGELAQPYEELVTAHQNMIFAAGQQVISGVDQRRLAEQRQALTMLRTYKPGRVSTVRTATASGAGVFPASVLNPKSNSVIPIYEDIGANPRGAEAAPVSILSIAKRQEAPKENTIKPGVWTTAVPQQKTTPAHRTPNFTVHEDSDDLPTAGIILPVEFYPVTHEDFTNWKPLLFYPEPEDPSKIPMYPKAKVYSDGKNEISIEEIRARRYIKRPANRLNVSPIETEQAIQSILGNSSQQPEIGDHCQQDLYNVYQQGGNEQQNIGDLYHQQTQYAQHVEEPQPNIHHVNTFQQQQVTPMQYHQPHIVQHNQHHGSFIQQQQHDQAQSNYHGNFLHQDAMQHHGSYIQQHQNIHSDPQHNVLVNHQHNFIHQQGGGMQENQQHTFVHHQPQMNNYVQQHNSIQQFPHDAIAQNQDVHQHSIKATTNNHSLHQLINRSHHQSPQQSINQQHSGGKRSHSQNDQSFGRCTEQAIDTSSNKNLQNVWSQQKVVPFQDPSPQVSFSSLHGKATVDAASSSINVVGNDLNDLWRSPNRHNDSLDDSLVFAPKNNVSKFAIYEESNIGLQEQIHPKGSAMKTLPFKILSAEELAETGSRGGLDAATTAQPGDGAKRVQDFEDDSSSSFSELQHMSVNVHSPYNTQLFNFNLNEMKVSTPQSKQTVVSPVRDEAVQATRKQLFAAEPEKKHMSTILEETKSYGSSSSSGGSGGSTTIKSGILSHSKRDNMAVISEEQSKYHFNLSQNLKANAALRSSLLELMECESGQSSPVTEVPIEPLVPSPSDPFKPALLRSLLDCLGFPGRHSVGYVSINGIPRLAARKEYSRIGDDRFLVEKILGKGQYGQVFKAIEARTNRPVALKLQKPPNCWEYYICRELQDRLAKSPLRERFMDVRIGYFSDLASVLVSDFVPNGSLLDVANAVKQKLGRTIKESLCIYFCIDMLNIVKVMHTAHIIHADIKPDNFLVQLLPDGTITLQLIDFGCSIDMSLFPSGTTFKRRVTTEDFVCCEMRDGRPWSYHTDLFCVAATAHVLLFDKYIQVQKKADQWSITQRFTRYMRLDLWNMFFSSLLNQQEGPANPEPLRALLQDALQQSDDFPAEMRSLINILKNR